MHILYFKSEKGNFGDDLNPWLWPKIFKETNKLADSYFLGIGSILHAGNLNLKNIAGEKKIVFGTGIRPSNSYEQFKIDGTWDIKFLRGPLSAKYLGNNYKFISDAAYAIRLLKDFSEIQKTEKKYEVSIMPYFHSTNYFNWERIAGDLGFNLISPHSEQGVEHTIREIAASKYLVSEAMHGAILADILRVPWHRFVLTTPYTEGGRVSDFKWNDWMSSINVYQSDISFIPFYQKTKLHVPIRKITGNTMAVNFFVKQKVIKELINSLKDISSYSLSHDGIIKTIDERISEKVYELNKEF